MSGSSEKSVKPWLVANLIWCIIGLGWIGFIKFEIKTPSARYRFATLLVVFSTYILAYDHVPLWMWWVKYGILVLGSYIVYDITIVYWQTSGETVPQKIAAIKFFYWLGAQLCAHFIQSLRP